MLWLLDLLPVLILFALVAVAAYTDLTEGKVYNWATYPAVALGFLIAYAHRGPGPEGLGSAVLGAGIGLVVFGLAWLAGAMGGGDVKLMGAIGALMGYPFIVEAMVWAGLIGAVLAIGILAWSGRLVSGLAGAARALLSLRGRASDPAGVADPTAAPTVPYGLAIALGTVVAFFLYRL